MKNKELIEMLSKHDPENDVFLSKLYGLDPTEESEEVFEVCHTEDASIQDPESLESIGNATFIYFAELGEWTEEEEEE